MSKRMTIEQWRQVDWSKDNKQLSKDLNKTYDTVAKKRWLLKSGRANSRSERVDKGVSKTTFIPSLEQQAKATKAAQGSVLAGRTESNIHAKEWVLVSPTDKIYHIKNLHHFVRQNPHLFNESDVIWKRKSGVRGTGGEYCNATAGISNIQGGKTQAWKGWRLKQPHAKQNKRLLMGIDND